MAKVNVYLPDDLERSVRAAGLSVSPVCQVALEEAVGRIRAATEHGSVDGWATDDLREVLDDARATRTEPGVLDVFGALVLHGDNLGARVLRELGVELPPPQGRRHRGQPGRGRFDPTARALIASAARAAYEMRHAAVGTEHLVVAATSVPPTDALLAALSITDATVRRHVERVRATAPPRTLRTKHD